MCKNMNTKIRNDPPQWRTGLRLAASLVFATSLAACANRPNTDPAMTSAKLVYVDDEMMFRSRLKEAGLLQIGCTYESHDPTALLTLQRLLGDNHFDDAQTVSQMIEPRYGLYFEKEDGSTHALLFDRQFNDSARRYGTFDAKPITIEGNLASQLVQWAGHANIPQSNPHCNSTIPRKAL
jgi:hypothetical protein